jgi:Domain of unknown function (DUF5666)
MVGVAVACSQRNPSARKPTNWMILLTSKMEETQMNGKTKTVRILTLIAVGALALAACAPSSEAPETQPAASPVETAESVTASSVPASDAELELTGTVEQIAPAAWTVNGKVLAILAATEIKGSFQVGDMVRAHAVVQADGSLAAREIGPVESASPAFLPGAEFDFTGTVDAISIDQWTVAGKTLPVTAATEIKGSFNIGELVKVHLLTRLDGSQVAREIEAPEAELERAGEGSEVELVALIDSISPEAWVVGGQTLAITSETEIKGTFSVGDAVKVHILVGAGGSLKAREIEAAEVGEIGDGNQDDDGNLNANANENENENENGNTNENSSNLDDNGNSNGDDSGGNSGSGGGGNDNGNSNDD